METAIIVNAENSIFFYDFYISLLCDTGGSRAAYGVGSRALHPAFSRIVEWKKTTGCNWHH